MEFAVRHKKRAKWKTLKTQRGAWQLPHCATFVWIGAHLAPISAPQQRCYSQFALTSNSGGVITPPSSRAIFFLLRGRRNCKTVSSHSRPKTAMNPAKHPVVLAVT